MMAFDRFSKVFGSGKTTMFTIPEKYSLSMIFFYIVVCFIFWGDFANPLYFLGLNTLLALFISLTAKFSTKSKWQYTYLLRNILIAVSVFVIYSQIFEIIDILNPHIIDDTLIKLDLIMIGSNISDIASSFTYPLITEALQIAYFLFFPAMIFQGIILYKNHTHNDFDLFIRNIIFAFYLSYIGYILFPAIGPRFMVGDFATLYDSLPGLYLTDYIRHIIDSGGGISDPSLAISQVNKDCMPSGHTMMSIVNIWFAYRFNIKYKNLIGVITFLIIFSTLYLQYHYLVDVIAGIFAAFLSLWLEPYIARIISSKR